MKTNRMFENRYNVLLLILSGVILGFSFPPFKFGIISIIGLVPLLYVIDGLSSFKKVFKYSYLTFFVFNLIACYWVGGWGNETDIFLMISGVALIVIHPFFFTIPILVYKLIQKLLNKFIALIFLPFIWVSFEYLHSITEFAFPWLLLGNTQTYNIYDIQYITFTGVYGISFWIVLMNILIYYLHLKFLYNQIKIKSINGIITILIVLLFFFLPNIISKIILDDYSEQISNKKIKVAIIQPNIDPWEKWKKSKEFEQVITLLNKSNLVKQNENVDLIVWPETAIPFYIRQPSRSEELALIYKSVDSIKTNILTGAADLKIYASNENIPPSAKKMKGSDIAYDSYNSIFLFEPGKRNIQVYHKIKLVPFSERIPYLDAYPFLINFLEWGVGISNWGIGKDSTIFSFNFSDTLFLNKNINSNTEKVNFWAMVCYESIFPGFVSEFVKKGAEFLVIVTNDSWFGNSSGPYQHNQFAVLRAIENRRSIVRCANGGVSSFIDPIGRIQKKSQFNTETILIDEIELNSYQTFYTKYGDVFSKFSLYISIVIILISFINYFLKIFKSKTNE
ncbi:MAG TPA: apolipoprotein N-acyltransferase [Bacteroidota bacterium]|nr:apolipoprotein N-acyltransferase [Bacteroidota bacterium]